MAWNNETKKTYRGNKAHIYISCGAEHLEREHEKGKLARPYIDRNDTTGT